MAAVKDRKSVQPQHFLVCLKIFRQCNLCTKKIPRPPPPQTPIGECKVLCVFKVIRITGSPRLLYTTRPESMYEGRAIDLQRGVPFSLLTRYVKFLFTGNKQNSCTNNYGTFMN